MTNFDKNLTFIGGGSIVPEATNLPEYKILFDARERPPWMIKLDKTEIDKRNFTYGENTFERDRIWCDDEECWGGFHIQLFNVIVDELKKNPEINFKHKVFKDKKIVGYEQTEKSIIDGKYHMYIGGYVPEFKNHL